nr:NSFL1 cofactor p47 [Hymenolepis microstoma]
MSDDDHTNLVNQVVNICDIDADTAKSYLEAFNWDLNATVENILNETDDVEISVTRPTESSTSAFGGSNTPRPKPDASHTEKPAASGPMFATMSSLSRRSEHDSDLDSEEGQAFYVGGAEHGGGGQQVLGPPRIDNPESFVREIFQAARKRGAETLDRARVDDLPSSHGPPSFSGTGYRLGTTLSDPKVRVESGKPSSSIGIGSYHQNSDDDDEKSEEKKSVVVKLWNNGFSLDDGPLRLYTDPSSVQFIGAIRAGLIPPELIAAARGHEVHVMLEDHHNEPFQAPSQPKLKPFSGVGRMLGNPTPKVVSNTSPPASSFVTPPAPELDESKPITQLQVRMPDSSRIVVRLNNHHTVKDLRAAIIHQRPELASAVFSLSIPFPRTDIKNDSATLASANLLNASIVVTKQ